MVAQGGQGGFAQASAPIDAGELGGFDQAVEKRGDLGAALGARAVVVLAADAEWHCMGKMRGEVALLAEPDSGTGGTGTDAYAIAAPLGSHR